MKLRDLEDHIGLLSSVGLFLVVATKILRVANGDVASAASLIQAGGPISVTFGVVVTQLSSILFMLSMVSGSVIRVVEDGASQVACVATWLGCSLALCFVGYWWEAAAAFLLPPLYDPILYLLAKRLKSKGASLAVVSAEEDEEAPGSDDAIPGPFYWWRIGLADVFLVTLIFSAALPFFFSIFSAQPWLPPERLRVVSGGPAIVGYVISKDDAHTTVLLHATRQIQYVPTDQVVERQICETIPWRGSPSRTVWQMVSGRPSRPRYETCWR
jgi:hypothetical protein